MNNQGTGCQRTGSSAKRPVTAETCVTGNAYRSEMFIFVLELNGASLFGHRLISRIVVVSLMMSGCCGGVSGQLCGEDKFYDAVVDECALCSDVCNLCLAPESKSFCVRNCPGSTLTNIINIARRFHVQLVITVVSDFRSTVSFLNMRLKGI